MVRVAFSLSNIKLYIMSDRRDSVANIGMAQRGKMEILLRLLLKVVGAVGDRQNRDRGIKIFTLT